MREPVKEAMRSDFRLAAIVGAYFAGHIAAIVFCMAVFPVPLIGIFLWPEIPSVLHLVGFISGVSFANLVRHKTKREVDHGGHPDRWAAEYEATRREQTSGGK